MCPTVRAVIVQATRLRLWGSRCRAQFTAEEFTHAVLGRGAKLSMDGRGAWCDNVFVERLWRSVKYERVYLRANESVSHARTDIAEYIDWYNTERGHTSMNFPRIDGQLSVV
jgi:transposase InsO family protein